MQVGISWRRCKQAVARLVAACDCLDRQGCCSGHTSGVTRAVVRVRLVAAACRANSGGAGRTGEKAYHEANPDGDE